jgi:hypothetical protein
MSFPHFSDLPVGPERMAHDDALTHFSKNRRSRGRSGAKMALVFPIRRMAN